MIFIVLIKNNTLKIEMVNILRYVFYFLQINQLLWDGGNSNYSILENEIKYK